MNRLSRLIVFVVAGAMLATVTACATRIKSPPGMTTTVVLLRHADRPAGADELSPGGHARARSLVNAVKHLDIDAIYSPNLVRNIDTVKPLAEARGLDITVADVFGVASRMVEEHPGKTVLWVGNTSNLDVIFNQLGGEGSGPNRYGELFILRVPDGGKTEVERSRYGKELGTF